MRGVCFLIVYPLLGLLGIAHESRAFSAAEGFSDMDFFFHLILHPMTHPAGWSFFFVPCHIHNLYVSVGSCYIHYLIIKTYIRKEIRSRVLDCKASRFRTEPPWQRQFMNQRSLWIRHCGQKGNSDIKAPRSCCVAAPRVLWVFLCCLAD